MKKLLSLILVFLLVSQSFVYATEGNNIVPNGTEGNEQVEVKSSITKTSDFKFVMNVLPTEGSTTDKDRNYELMGTIYLPSVIKSDKVFYFIHGRMNFNKDAHKGFNYIIDDLCDLGYRVISLNICYLYKNPTLTTLETNNVIQAVNESLTHIMDTYPDFGDINVLSFIGHSRGGFHVLKVTEDLLSKGYTVESVLSIAPYVLDWDKISLPDVETTILVPEFDGDVYELDGCKWYSDAVDSKKTNRTTILRNIYLYGGNHNFFSTEMLIDDTSYLTGTPYDVPDKNYCLTREEQEQFLLDVVLKYMTTDANKNIELKSLHNYKQFDSFYTRLDLDKVSVSVTNGYYLPVSLKENIVSSYNNYSWLIEPGTKESIYDIIRFKDKDGYVVFDIENSKYSEILLEMLIDYTGVRVYNANLEVTVDYLGGKADDIFTFDINNPMGKEKKKSGVSNVISWDRKTPFNQFSLDVDENSVVDRIIVKVDKPSQLAINRIFIRDAAHAFINSNGLNLVNLGFIGGLIGNNHS